MSPWILLPPTRSIAAWLSVTRQIMSDRQKQFQSKVLGQGKKQVYYLCMEFLMGRSLRSRACSTWA